jgi:hypothetical protein
VTDTLRPRPWGYPASLLSDNGLICSTRRDHQVAGVTEQELFALGFEAKHARPYHPQTCGKASSAFIDHEEVLGRAGRRGDQKAAPAPAGPLPHLYNEVRPHRCIGSRTPAAAYNAREKAGPSPSFVQVGERRLRFDRVDKSGRVTLRHRGRLHDIGIGTAYTGWRVAMLVEDLDIEIVGLGGSPLRRLVLDPAKDNQRIP